MKTRFRLQRLILAGLLLSSTCTMWSQNVTLKFKKAKLENVLSAIKSQTGYSLIFSDQIVNVDRPVSIDVKEIVLEQALTQLLDGTGLSFEVKNNKIYLIEKGLPEKVTANTTQKKITGTVKDVNGEAIIGANVIVKGTSIGSITDINGNFSFDVPNSGTLVVSYIGYLPQDVAISGKNSFAIVLKDDSKALDEVVVVGYGTQKKKLLTGATINMSGEDIQKMNTVSPLTAMQSQSPGVSITKTSGKPGDGFKINIRGLGTIGNADPLVIIDNVVGGDLNMLNASDIEAIDVLKDAASAAIYGARAANGVILVKTKQGKRGKTSVSYDGYFGIQKVSKYVDVLNAPEYIALTEESYAQGGSPAPNWEALVPEYENIKNGWTGTNWQKEFTNDNAPVQNHAINLTGGSEASTFSLGMSYTSQEGVYGKPAAPQYNRYSVRVNSEHVLYKIGSLDVVKFGENILYNYIDQQRNRFATGNKYYNDMHSIIGMNPFMPVYDENGDFSKSIPWADAVNPIGNYVLNRSNSSANSHNLRINPYLEIRPIEGLVLKSSFGYKYSSSNSRGYVPAYDLGSVVQTLDKVDQSASSGYSYQLENTINYKFNIKEVHSFDALIGQSIEKNGFGASVSGSNRGSIFNSFEYAYLDNVHSLVADNLSIGGAPFRASALASFFGRVNYNYSEKYMASVIMRADGSSNFAKGNRWGYFPSVAAGWIVSNEAFMEPTRNVMDYFKLRASWGQNGNQDIAPFQYLASYAFSGADYYFGPEKNSVDVGAYPNIIPNEDVAWETSEQLNIGFDARFFNSRLGVNFDWYRKTTRDWLVQAPIPAVFGGSAPYINGGDIENKGVELVLSWSDRIGDLRYSVSGNMSYNKNEVIRIANDEGIIEGSGALFSTSDRMSFYRAQVGYPIGYFYGYQTAGVFQSKEQILNYKDAKLAGAVPGDLIFVNTDGNDVIDVNDKTMIGDPNPDVIFGFNLGLEYKGFDFSLAASGVAGNQIAWNMRAAEKTFENFPSAYLGRWHGEGTSNRYPRISTASSASSNWGWNSDIYIEDGGYLRIQNVTLGYDFQRLMKNTPFKQARVYVSVNNLVTFTGYKGADPEIGYAAESWSKGIDLGSYPTPRTFIVGLNLKF